MIHITSHMMKTIWTPILFFILAITAFLATLLYGIRINSLELPGLNVERLYIKLDKKLIVEAKNITIKKTSKKETSKEEVLALIEQLPWLNRLFSIIDIKAIELENKKIKILYKDNIFYIDSSYLTLDAKLSPIKGGLHVDISELFFKDVDASLKGKVDVNLKKDRVLFFGDFHLLNIQGKASVKLEKDLLTYKLSSSKFDSLEPIMKYLEANVEMEEEVGLWTYKKITAKSFKLHTLKGKVDIKTGEFYPKQMYGKAHATNVVVKFHPDVPPAKIKDLDIILEDDMLKFRVAEATYEDINVKNPNVYIYNILTSGNGIVITLKTSTKLDERIHKILKAYDVNIPITQQSGLVDAIVKLDIRFLPYDLDIKGFFLIKDSALMLSNAPMYSKSAQITLDNHLVTLEDTNLVYEGLFDINANGKINTREGTLNGSVDINSLTVGFGKDPILDLNKGQIPVKMSFTKDDLSIVLPTLNASLLFKEGYNEIKQDKLSLLYDYSTLMQQNKIKEGNVRVETKDFTDFNISLNMSDIMTPLLKNSLHVNTLNLDIKANKDIINGQTKNGDLRLNVDKNGTYLYLDDYDIVVKDENESSESNLNVEVHDGNIILKDFNRTILSELFDVNINGDDLKLTSVFGGGKIDVKSTKQSINVEANDQIDHFVNTLLHKKIFDGGKFALNLQGSSIQSFTGAFGINESYLHNMKLYNDILSLINTLPALATFKSPDFNEKGYRIKKATITFSREGDVVTFHDIHIDGVTADIKGKGTLNLANENIFLDLSLSTLKDVSKIVDKIPALNYILLGKEGDITTSIKVKGTLDDPEVKTQVLKDTLSTPVNIIKRTLELPFKLFRD